MSSGPCFRQGVLLFAPVYDRLTGPQASRDIRVSVFPFTMECGSYWDSPASNFTWNLRLWVQALPLGWQALCLAASNFKLSQSHFATTMVSGKTLPTSQRIFVTFLRQEALHIALCAHEITFSHFNWQNISREFLTGKRDGQVLSLKSSTGVLNLKCCLDYPPNPWSSSYSNRSY